MPDEVNPNLGEGGNTGSQSSQGGSNQTTQTQAADLTPQNTGGSQQPQQPSTPPQETRQPQPEQHDAGRQSSGPDFNTADGLLDALMKLPARELDRMMDAIEDEVGPMPDSRSQPQTRPEAADDDEYVDEQSYSDPDEPIRYNRLEPGLQHAVGAVHHHLATQALQTALDTDQDLSYNMRSASPEAREAAKSLVRDRMERIVQERGDRFDYNWETAARQALKAEKSRLSVLLERPVNAGMGPGPGGAYSPQELREPARVPAHADPRDREAYLMERMRYNAAKIEREQANNPVGG